MEAQTSSLVEVKQIITSAWWLLLFRGIAGIILGLFALFAPGLTLVLFAQLMGAYLLVDGCFSFAAAVTGHVEKSNRPWTMVRAVIQFIAGFLVLSQPVIATTMTSALLVFLVASLLIVFGVSDMVYGFKWRKAIENEWTYIILGLLSVILGVLFFAAPGLGLQSVMMFLGITGVVMGTAVVVLALRLRSMYKKAHGAIDDHRNDKIKPIYSSQGL